MAADQRIDSRILFTRYNQLLNRLFDRFDNWLYRVNGV